MSAYAITRPRDPFLRTVVGADLAQEQPQASEPEETTLVCEDGLELRALPPSVDTDAELFEGSGGMEAMWLPAG